MIISFSELSFPLHHLLFENMYECNFNLSNKPNQMKNRIYTFLIIVTALMGCNDEDDDNDYSNPPQASKMIYDENTDGDLSESFDAPDGPFKLYPGNNIIISEQRGEPRDIDYFSVSVPEGYELSALNLTDYAAASENLAFIGIVVGGSFTTDENSTGADDLLGGKVYGSQDLNMNILPDIGNLQDAQGFSDHLTAGVYSIWLNQTGSKSKPTFDFVVKPI